MELYSGKLLCSAKLWEIENVRRVARNSRGSFSGIVPNGKKTMEGDSSLPPFFFLPSSFELLFANTVFDREEMKKICAMG